jgi:hypothetical protein
MKPLSNELRDFFAENLLFVFVCLDGLSNPKYHIVPRKDVSRHCRLRHKRWLSTPRRDGTPHKDTSMRRFEDRVGKYLDKGDLLGLGDKVVA